MKFRSTRLQQGLAIVAMSLVALAMSARPASAAAVSLGHLDSYLFFFADGSQDATWSTNVNIPFFGLNPSPGYKGNVAYDGTQATEQGASGFFQTTPAFAGTLFTNASNQSNWASIVANNAGQATSSVSNGAKITGLETDLTNAFTQINGLSATAGYTSVSSSVLNGLNTQNGIAETFVINITSGFSVSSHLNVTGDATDRFILRWDSNTGSSGYQGTVSFSDGGCINPLGGLTPTNFISVAGDLGSGGSSNNINTCTGLQPYLNQLDAINNGTQPVNGGGAFTGYWLTTGDPTSHDTGSLNGAVFVGGWYTTTDNFQLEGTAGGVWVAPPGAAPEPASMVLLGSGLVFLAFRLRKRA